MAIRTILFDFGNVIAFFDHQRAVQKLAAFTDRPAPELTLQIYGGAPETFYEKGKISTAQFIDGAIKDSRLKCSPEFFHAAFIDIFWPNLPIHRLIEKLAPNYRLVLASNTNEAHFTHYRKEYAEVLKHFAFLGVSHEAGMRKPHRGFFEYCQRQAECEPGECLFIDDLSSNVEAAILFGWNGIVYADEAELMVQLRKHGIEI